MLIRRMVTGAFTLALALSAAEARAQSVAGTYLVEYDAHVRMGGGGEAPAEPKAQARLAFEVKGDSIVGTWSIVSTGAAPAREVRGTVQGKTIKFSTAGQARLNINGEARTVQTTTTYSATIEGDQIKGTIDSQAVDGSFQAPTRAFTGKREKA